MSDNSEDSDPYTDINREKYLKAKEERESHKIEKDPIPNFFPTYRISRNLYPIPIIITVICAGLLAYATYVLAQVHVEGGYISEEEHGATAGLLNGIIFTAIAAGWSFLIILLIKKFGIEVLKYIFGISFGFIGFFLTLLFGEIIIYLIFVRLPPTKGLVDLYYFLVNWVLVIGTGIFTFIMIWKYFTAETHYVKNFVVVYIGLLIGAIMGVIMPLWTTLAMLICISLWDIFAVKSKRGPIKEMIDMFSADDELSSLSDEEMQAKIASGEIEYDTSNLEIGIGDLAFYSMLTSAALIQTGSVFIMILTAIAIIIGTGITISYLKKNKILPGLPISIFLGIVTWLISWWVIILIF